MRRLWDAVAIFLFVAAVLGPVGTYVTWKNQASIHRLHTEGIETQAEIVGAVARKYKGTVSYTLDVKWVSKSGTQHSGKVAASGGYGERFFSTADPFGPNGIVELGAFRITAKTVPVKYLESDPSSVILHLDPGNSEESQASRLNSIAGLSAAGIAGTLLLLVLGYVLRPAGPGGYVLQEGASPGGLGSWAIWSALVYAILAGLHFIPAIHSLDVGLFGREPYGIPVTMAVIGAGTVLYLPMIWVFRQVERLDWQRRMDGSWMPGITYNLCGGWHRHLAGSAAAVWLGGLYVIALGASLLAYSVNLPPPTGVATAESIKINKAFPGAERIAARLVQAGFAFDEDEDWFGPRNPKSGSWAIEIGAQIDVTAAQQIIAICTEEYRGDIYILLMADPAAYRDIKAIHIGLIHFDKPAHATGNIQAMLKPGISAEELHRLIMQQSASDRRWPEGSASAPFWTATIPR